MPAEKPANLIPALGLVAVTVKVTSIVLAVALTEAMLIVNCVAVTSDVIVKFNTWATQLTTLPEYVPEEVYVWPLLVHV